MSAKFPIGVATTYSAGRSIDSDIRSLDTVLVMNFRLPSPSACVNLILFFCLTFAAGCGPQQAVKPVKPTTAPNANAEARLHRGDYIGAATEFARLANINDTRDSSRYRIMAALAYLDGGDPQSAATLLVGWPPEAATAEQLYALALAAADTFSAGTLNSVRLIESVEPKQLSPYQRSVYYRALGRQSMFNRTYAAAATAFIAADEYILPTAKRLQLHNNIWSALSHMDDVAIQTARATGLRRESPWLDLAIAARPNLHNSAALASVIENWQAKHPQHPANITLVEQLYELSESLSAQARHIALLLPFQGAYANAAVTIRDGFLSAWYAASNSATRPTISIYSVNQATVNAVYDTAIANGADLIVGPLEKSTVEVLTARPELPVRTLTLNVTDNSVVTGAGDELAGSARLFQFGLSPEDEAIAAAEKAWSDGHSRAITLVPQTPWGKRLTKEFTNRWQELGGSLLTEAPYGGTENTYAQSVKHALNIDRSEARAAALRSALNRPIQFEPRRRADVQAIFVAGFPLSTRQLVPQLRYFRAESVPMYSTSHTYTGATNAAADQDLDGLRFGDMPWLFGAADANSFELFKRNWPERAPGSGRLFAFGLDAYRIVPYLSRMRFQPSLRLPGTTGQLHMTPNGRVLRGLTWARFASGVPVLIDR